MDSVQGCTSGHVQGCTSEWCTGLYQWTVYRFVLVDSVQDCTSGQCTGCTSGQCTGLYYWKVYRDRGIPNVILLSTTGHSAYAHSVSLPQCGTSCPPW